VHVAVLVALVIAVLVAVLVAMVVVVVGACRSRCRSTRHDYCGSHRGSDFVRRSKLVGIMEIINARKKIEGNSTAVTARDALRGQRMV
jgi:hypothetical protein